MDLINTTAVPARLWTSKILDDRHRIGTIAAKATFLLTPSGPELDTQDPFPLFNDDRDTELGILPRDDFPRRDPAFEVIVLGAAHAPGGKAIERMLVSLSVGETRRELLVTGDRTWEQSPSAPRISPAQPFLRLPLSYDRAFGGSCDVEIDREAFVEVADPRNPRGKGFDPAPGARAVAETLGCPEGYPRFDTRRLLPNIQDPAHPIANYDDAPRPVFWAAMPLDSAMQAERSVIPPENTGDALIQFPASIYHRAHPDWVIDLPAREATVTMRGLSAGGGEISFRLPPVQLFVDYVSGLRRGTRELVPQLLVLLPEEGRFYIVFRHSFTFEYPSAERSMRLRVEAGGWYAPPEEG